MLPLSLSSTRALVVVVAGAGAQNICVNEPRRDFGSFFCLSDYLRDCLIVIVLFFARFTASVACGHVYFVDDRICKRSL